MKIEISILLPTRGRTAALKNSITSLLDRAKEPHKIEILLGFDHDDTSSFQWFQDNTASAIEDAGAFYTCFGFDRLGYIKLNEYINYLAGHSQGHWLMFWNDDAVMQSQDWDNRILEHNDHFRVLRMPTHRDHPYAIFPILPRSWYELFGYISQHQLNDAWISQIAYMLDIMHNIDVKVTHDRHDLTGNNNDDTFRERVILEGKPEDPRDFNNVFWRQRRMQDAARICEMLEQQGHDMPWFRAVVSGKQNPWAKMVSPEYDPNKQLAIFQ